MTSIKYSASKYASVGCLLLLSIGIDLILTQNLKASERTSEIASEMISDPNQLKLEIETDTVADAVYLSTLSYGCTSSTDFGFREDADGRITAFRLTQDRCRRKPFTVTFRYGLAEIYRAIQAATVDTPAMVEGIRIKR